MEKYTTVTQHLGQGYPNCDPPGRFMRPAPTFLNYVLTVKIAQQLSRLSVPLTVTFTRAALYDERCALPPPPKIWTPLVQALKSHFNIAQCAN